MSEWWERYEASFPDGVNLAPSSETPGWLRGFFVGEGGIEGHAEFSKVDLRKPAVIGAAVFLVAGVLGTIAVVKSTPRVKRWWADQAIPAVREVRRRFARRQDAVADEVTADLATSSRAVFEAFTHEVDIALEDCGSRMSSAEAQRHLLEILLAAAFIADRMRILSTARVEEDVDLPELRAAMAKLTTQQVADTINRMLATNSAVLDGETSEIMARLFGGGHVVDGAYVPLGSARVREALSLDPPCHSRASRVCGPGKLERPRIQTGLRGRGHEPVEEGKGWLRRVGDAELADRFLPRRVEDGFACDGEGDVRGVALPAGEGQLAAPDLAES